MRKSATASNIGEISKMRLGADPTARVRRYLNIKEKFITKAL
jgi:hypothetical protein